MANSALGRLLSFMCGAKKRFLCFDDIQWADQSSLDVINVLELDGDTEYLILTVAYPDEEVVKNIL